LLVPPRRWRQNVPSKHWLTFNGPYCVISQTKAFFKYRTRYSWWTLLPRSHNELRNSFNAFLWLKARILLRLLHLHGWHLDRYTALIPETVGYH
jgi:hypothetical protein